MAAILLYRGKRLRCVRRTGSALLFAIETADARNIPLAIKIQTV